jgi:hypothetical protein
VPSPIFVATIIGVENLLSIDLDGTQGPVSFVRQVLDRLPEGVPAFGKPIGFVINANGGAVAEWLEFEGGVISALFQPTESALSRRWRRKWRLKCEAVADSLEEAGDKLFTFTRFPKSQWKSIRTGCLRLTPANVALFRASGDAPEKTGLPG